MIDDTLLEAEEKMEKAVEVAKEDFGAIRTGRANAAMFHKIMVDYYGAPTPLQQLASFQIPEARSVLITPFDRGAMGEIEKALRNSDLGVNPGNDGNVIRIVLPQLTEERRKDYIKLARSKAEDAASRCATCAVAPRRSSTASSRTARPARTRSGAPRRSWSR